VSVLERETAEALRAPRLTAELSGGAALGKDGRTARTPLHIGHRTAQACSDAARRVVIREHELRARLGGADSLLLEREDLKDWRGQSPSRCA
jgi:hypothetical protein